MAREPGDDVSTLVRRNGLDGGARAAAASFNVPIPGPLGVPGAWVAGTQPKGIDTELARMANDAYERDAGHGGQSEVRLNAAGWNRMVADPKDAGRLTDGRGHSITIDPARLHDERSGFDAAIYRHEDGRVVVAFAGTHAGPVEPGDIVTDVTQGIGMPASQYRDAVSLGRDVQQEVGPGRIAFTGHSLGGGLAATAALGTGEAAVTFNAAGVSNETLRSLDIGNPNTTRQQAATDGSIRSYAVEGDPLTTLDQRGTAPQLGTQWSLASTNPDVTVDDVGDLIALHGGSGPDQLYVTGLEQKKVSPGVVESPFIEGGIQLGAAASAPLALVVPGLAPVAVGSNVFAALPPAERTALLNQMGNGVHYALSMGTDAFEVSQESTSDLAGHLRNDSLNPVTGGGIAADAGLDLFGAGASNATEFGGRTLTNVTDTLGTHIRERGRSIGLDDRRAQQWAGAVEGTGNVFRDRLIATGAGVDRLADVAGNAIQWGTDKVDPRAPVRAGGAAVNGVLDAAGIGAASVADLGGRKVDLLARGTGLSIRQLGRREGFDGRHVDQLASVIEVTGGFVRGRIESAGQRVRAVTDTAGNAIEWASRNVPVSAGGIAKRVMGWLG